MSTYWTTDGRSDTLEDHDRSRGSQMGSIENTSGIPHVNSIDIHMRPSAANRLIDAIPRHPGSRPGNCMESLAESAVGG